MVRSDFQIWVGSSLLYAVMTLILVTAGCSQARTPIASESQANASEVVPSLPEPYHIEITGRNRQWHVRYPDETGRLATKEKVLTDRSIPVPRDTKVVFVLKSMDFLYTFAIPQFGLKEIAVPDLEFQLEFRSENSGRIEFLGEHLCGDPQSEMSGTLVVEPQDCFLAWLEE